MRKLPPKKRGELAEIRFLLAAASKGLMVAKPWGDSEPFDFLVGRDGRYLRVQVKSTNYAQYPGRYTVNCCQPGCRKPYSPREVDVIAVYVVPEDQWYVFPIDVLKGVTMITVSSRPRSRGQYDGYLDAWHLLRQ